MPTRARCQRRRVVDAVARHRHRSPLLLQRFNHFAFPRGRCFRDCFVQAELTRHRFGRAASVAGQHNQTQAVRVQQTHRLRC